MAEIGVNTALFLISPTGREWLSRTNTMFETLDPKAAVWPAQFERLRRDLTQDQGYQNAVFEANNSTGRLDVGEVAGALIELSWLRQRQTRYLAAKDERRLKFGDLPSANLYATRSAYEQASNSVVAAHRARRYASHCRRSLVRQVERNQASDPTALTWRLADMGCGCGGDIIALAHAIGRVDRQSIAAKAGAASADSPAFHITLTGIDTDPARLILAAANLAALQQNVSVSLLDPAATERVVAALRQFAMSDPRAPQIILEQADITAPVIQQRLASNTYDAIFLDPARRTANGERIFHISDYQPPLAPLIERWLEAQESVPRGGRTIDAGLGIKLSPGVDYAELDPYAPGETSELEFISQRGALKEAVLWFGPLRTHSRSTPPQPIRTRATILTNRSDAPTTLTGTIADDSANEDALRLPEVNDYLLEPDPAIIRAHLVADLARQSHAARLDPNIAYLVLPRAEIGQATSIVPCAQPYHIEAVLFPFSVKALRAAMQGRNIERGQVVIKKRGSPIDPQKLIQSLKLPAKIVQDDDESRPVSLSTPPGNATIIILTRIGDKPIAFITRAVPPL